MPDPIKIWVAPILVRDDFRDPRPFEIKVRIVIAHTAFVVRRVKLINEVKGLSVCRQGHKAMREALWHVHHPTVFGGQLGTKALAECSRPLTQIEDQIIKCTTDTTHELGFCFGSKLIMQAAQGAIGGTERVVNLTEMFDETM